MPFKLWWQLKITVNNKKDLFFNDLVDWYNSEDLTWKLNEIQSAGTAANALHILYVTFLDGHHTTLADRWSHVQSFLQNLLGI